MKVTISSIDNLEEVLINEWCALFNKCFRVTENTKRLWDTKYASNRGYVAYILQSGRMVAAYTVLLDTRGRRIGLSVDTMSDGSIKHATSKICERLYPFLENKGIDILIGFPNKNITSLRVKYLGWKKGGTLYFKLYFKGKVYRRLQPSLTINRSSSLFFGNQPILTLLSAIYLPKLIEINASLNKFDGGINFAKKDWFYKVLAKKTDVIIEELTYESIDVP